MQDQGTALSVAGAAQPTEWVPIGSLRAGDSPRLDREREDHTRLLAESAAKLPPILVQRRTMRVIDGMHRLRAAQLRGEQSIEVEFFDGDDDDAFILAVRGNITHGLPLTLADRKAAAARILTSHARYSDRSIAAITGLSAETVAGIRRRGEAGTQGPGDVRVGRDGRVRPLSGIEGRTLASRAIAAQPEASLREIARVAGLSPTTVRDVRERMLRGEDPVPEGRPTGRKRRAADPTEVKRPLGEDRRARPVDRDERFVGTDKTSLLDNLSRDPSLRFSESGRNAVRALLARSGGPPPRELTEALPPHCMYTVAALARICADEWRGFADQMEYRAAMPETRPGA
ncbi:MAG: hypothetical protein V7603_1154 [Micromonosporaceae bacterium]